MSKHSQLLRSVADLIHGSHYDHSRESVREFVARGRLTREQMAWATQQRHIGAPSFARLRGAMHLAGLLDVTSQPAGDRETFDFLFSPGPDVTAQTTDDLMRLLIRTFRSAGFKIGWEDICFVGVYGDRIEGIASVTAVSDGPLESWQLPETP